MMMMMKKIGGIIACVLLILTHCGLLLPYWIFCDEIRIFNYMYNYVNTMAADALAPCITRPSAAMVSTIQDKQICFSLKSWNFSYLFDIYVEKW